MKQFNLILPLLFFSCFVQAQILTVKQDGGGDYVKIQDAIDHATDGDTVLVWPGIYFENIMFNYTGIVLGSLYMTTGENHYIEQTIIDGAQNGRCVHIYYHDVISEVNGFTIQNGNTYSFPNINGGGGINITETKARIKSCIVQNNFAKGYGGGIYCKESDVLLSNTCIKNNHSFSRGGGICMLLGEILFDSINLCNVYLNFAPKGNEISKLGETPMKVFVDTFTVYNPDLYFVHSQNLDETPVYDIFLDILNTKVQTVNHDLYVNPNGDNSNSGTSADKPLKNLSYALSLIQPDTLNPKTINLAQGSYAPSKGEKWPLNMRSYVSIKGVHRDSSKLDGEGYCSIIQANTITRDFQISDISICNSNSNQTHEMGALYMTGNKNVFLNNVLLSNNKGFTWSAFFLSKQKNIYIGNSEISNNIGGSNVCIAAPDSVLTLFSADTAWFENCIFRNNKPDYDTIDMGYGGGLVTLGFHLYPDSLTVNICNCEFSNNKVRHVDENMAAASLTATNGSKVFIVNSTFGNNISDNEYGAGIATVNNSELNVYNSIIYANEPDQFFMRNNSGWQSDLNIYNSLVEDGIFGIKVYSAGNLVHYDDSNIDADPLWANDGWYPYMLMPGSPCINTGTLDLPSHIHLPETDLAGNPRVYDGQIDMGAYEFGPWVGLDYQKPKAKSLKLTASPNPFRNHCQIKYECKEKGQQSIFVYDLQGKRVATLMDITGQPASGQLNWNGTDDYGRKLKPGIYIIELSNNKRSLGSVKVEIVD
jgi:predicted outer membrane repeat protein